MNNLSHLYYTPSLPTALGGVKRLTSSQKVGKQIKAANAKRWLQSQDSYTLHKPVRKSFPRRKTIVSGMGEQLQTDLIDMQKFKKENDGVSYLLTAIDVFSKQAFVVPLKTKSGENVAAALKTVLAEKKFRTVQSDKGREYLNKHVQKLLQDLGVTHFTSESENIKASIVERFNRTLQSSMYRWMTHSNTNRYIDVLKDLVLAYNNCYHSSIGTTPNSVNESNQEDVWLRLYPPTLDKKKPKLKVGDHVRMTKARQSFHKGYTALWTNEIYVETKVKTTNPIVYEIEDLGGEKIVGTFYENELQIVTKPSAYKIETVLKRKTVRGKKKLFVKWLGYPDSFNQWIDASDIV